jgi:hypothetical protein
MAKWNFFVTNNSLIKELDTSGNDVNPQSQSFLSPTLDLQGAKIVFKEGGLYKTALLFTEIGTIDGVTPTDLQDAYDMIIALIPSSEGGGGVQTVTGPTVTGTPTDRVVGLPTFQQILNNNRDLVAGLNFQGTQAGLNNTGTESVNAFGVFSAKFNSGNDVNALGSSSAVNNTGNNVNAFGKGAARGNTYNNVNLFGQEAEADAENQTVFSKAVSSVSEFLARLSYNNITANRKYELPDISGTISLNTTATTGAVIAFANPQVYNSIASPSSSNLTDNLTGARIGVVQKIYHNAGTAPTVPAGWVLRGTGSYVTSTLNIIYAEWSVGTTVEYWITQ